MTERMIVYIDGFNLYYGMRSRGWRRFMWLDIQKLATNMLGRNQCLVKVHYFSSVVIYDPGYRGRQGRQQKYLKVIRSLPDVQIHLGRHVMREVPHHKCDEPCQFPQEKMTDVNIATNLLCDAHDDLFDVAMVVSSDIDLTGAVDAIRTRFENKRVIMCFPPDRTSKRLAGVAGEQKHLSCDVFSKSQLPDPFIIPGNPPVYKPSSWN